MNIKTIEPGSTRTIIALLIAGLLAITVTGCGGSGSVSDGGGKPPSSIPYTGNENQADITATNASTIVTNIIGGSDPSIAVSGKSSSQQSAIETKKPARQIVRYLRDTLSQIADTQAKKSQTAAKTNVNETEPCDSNSGTLTFSGVLADNGTGSLDVVYENCLLDGLTINGLATFHIDAFDTTFLEITDFTISFSRLSFIDLTTDIIASGTMRSEVTIKTNTERLIINIVASDQVNNKMTKDENVVIVTEYDNILFPSSFSETITGRVFDSEHGYVDVITNNALVFSDISLEFPDGGGQLLLMGVNGNILVTAVSATMVMLELDLDDNGSYEIIAILQWIELPKEEGENLSDSDMDGMHDSWEVANGFNPLDTLDADEDPDADGATNYEEYQIGTDPNDALSSPPIADLSITMVDSVNQVVAGNNFNYMLTVSNTGPDIAANVRVQDVLPPGLIFVSATGIGWSCNNLSGTVACSRSNLATGIAPVITVVVEAPFTSGSVSNTASVSTNALDSNSSNDSATEDTTILIPATSVNLDLGALAFDIEIDTVRQLLYVSVPDLNEVVIASLDTLTVLNRIVVGSNPHGMDLSQDGNTLYIALNQGGSVAMLDLNTLLVTEVVVAVELDTSRVYDVIAATPTEVFVSGNPNSGGFAYIVKIDTANGNLVTRVASNRIIRADPFFVASADQQFLYVSEGFSPNSVYQLDLTQSDVPLVLEDSHGSILFGSNEHLAINLDGSQLFLASGQVLHTDTLAQAALIGKGASTVSADGSKIFVGKAPNTISVYDTTTFLEIDTIVTTCNITKVERIIELQANAEWILLGQQNICSVISN